MDIYQELIITIKKKSLKEKQLNKLKRELARKYRQKTIPTNIQILLHAPEEEIPKLKAKLLTKPTRTISGVTPIAIMAKPSQCPHGKCSYCPGGINSPWGDVPQSYSGHEPATMRGRRNFYNSYLQVFNRLEQYVILGHSFDKVELIVMGGTFPAEEKNYQEEFIRDAFKALNDFGELFFEGKSFDGKGIDKKINFNFIKFKEFFELPGDINDQKRTENIQNKLLKIKNKIKKNKKNNLSTLESEQRRNETAKVRCVALCIETRPDYGRLEQGNEMLRQGCTRVELGIQSVYDDVLKHIERGHTTKDSIKSIQILRDLGFKINFHYMPGLPLTDRKKDLAGMKKLFTDSDYRPDMLKLYPCMVAKGTKLYDEWKEGKFRPLTTEEAVSLIREWKKSVPEYCRIQRIQRDVPTIYWESGIDRTNLRQYIHDNYPVKCRCIRCREPKGKKVSWGKVRLKVKEYHASQGKEFFISAEDAENDLLVGFCRLRFPHEYLRPEITKESALIRELHVYGTATAIGEEGVVQHKGWGKKLMKKAEGIAKKKGKSKMVVISGVGAREYYRKLGYEKEGGYMVKFLS